MILELSVVSFLEEVEICQVLLMLQLGEGTGNAADTRYAIDSDTAARALKMMFKI